MFTTTPIADADAKLVNMRDQWDYSALCLDCIVNGARSKGLQIHNRFIMEVVVRAPKLRHFTMNKKYANAGNRIGGVHLCINEMILVVLSVRGSTCHLELF